MPVSAQDSTPDASGSMERGLRLFMDGLTQEMEPALRDLQDLAEDTAPFLRSLQQELADVVTDLDAYQAPEILPNGDILIRRRDPLEGDEVEELEENPDGSIDL
jgi:hypothetical protein